MNEITYNSVIIVDPVNSDRIKCYYQSNLHEEIKAISGSEAVLWFRTLALSDFAVSITKNELIKCRYPLEDVFDQLTGQRKYDNNNGFEKLSDEEYNKGLEDW